MKRNVIIWFLLTLAGIFLVKLLTVDPYVISGNGNLGLIAIPIFFMGYVPLLLMVYRKAIAIHSQKIVLFVFFLIVLLFLTDQIAMQTMSTINALGGWTDDIDSRVYRYGWLNQYTNTLYINPFTALWGLSLSSLFGVYRSFFRPK